MTCCFLTDSVTGNGAGLLFYNVMFKTAAVERSYGTSSAPAWIYTWLLGAHSCLFPEIHVRVFLCHRGYF